MRTGIETISWRFGRLRTSRMPASRPSLSAARPNCLSANSYGLSTSASTGLSGGGARREGEGFGRGCARPRTRSWVEADRDLEGMHFSFVSLSTNGRPRSRGDVPQGFAAPRHVERQGLEVHLPVDALDVG